MKAMPFSEFAKRSLRFLPDKTFIRLYYRWQFHEGCNIKNPRTFNEKLQWLKLHDRNPLYTELVDKYAVKEWVVRRIGQEHVAKTYDRWDDAENIDISELPERFVLKTNHDCGGIAICRDRSTFNLDEAKSELSHRLKRNYFWVAREWPYKNVKPCVFAEEYLEPDAGEELTDYKLMCFNGRVRALHTCTGRGNGDMRIDFFDSQWNHLPIVRRYPNADVAPDKPAQLDEMIELAEKLSEGIPFVRVDFYAQSGRVIFGEMTFYPASGFRGFEPKEWDDLFGSMMDISEIEVRK